MDQRVLDAKHAGVRFGRVHASECDLAVDAKPPGDFEADGDILFELDVAEAAHLPRRDIFGPDHDEFGASRRSDPLDHGNDVGIDLGRDQDTVERARVEERFGDLGERLPHDVLMVLADVSEHPDLGAHDLALAHALIVRVDRHALDHECVRLGRQPAANNLDLFKDGRRPRTHDRTIDPVLVDHDRSGARGLRDRRVPGFAEHTRDTSRH